MNQQHSKATEREISHSAVLRLALVGVFAALSYAVFTFLQIKIPIGPGHMVSLHLGNAVCVLSALILGGVYGGLSGAIGMTIGDLLDPVYITVAPKTFLLKFCMGLITGLIAHRIAKITLSVKPAYWMKWSALAAFGALFANVILDPLIGYYYRILILGKPAAEVTFHVDLAATSINAIISLVVAVAVYMALRTSLQKSSLFDQLYNG
ncbi:hypothetical protein FACS189418_7990 [Clostridia bacterium]|nr:hypothetical protein FACS189418_7990 [Clostridia bacterium]